MQVGSPTARLHKRLLGSSLVPPPWGHTVRRHPLKTSRSPHLTFTGAHFIPIEHLEWSCLTIGALGWGQIQIANSNIVDVNRHNTRVDWMLSLCDALDIFYPREIAKISERLDYFHSVREYWESRRNH